MRINLGCGGDVRRGYLNIDVRPLGLNVLQLDLERLLLSPFPDMCAEEILAKDIIEHISWRRVEDLLRDCFRVLKPGGVMLVQVPDLEVIAKRVILDPNFRYGDLQGWKAISYWVYGAQDYPENVHKSGFTIPTLKGLLESIGFSVEEIRSDGGSNIVCRAVRRK